MTKTLAFVGLSMLVGALPACRQVECGQGTIEEDGVCVASGQVQPPVCGQGFYFDEVSGQCRSNAFDDAGLGICDPETTVAEVDDAGVVHCRGTGVVGGCEAAVSCQAPTGAGFISVCGRIYDTETSAPLDDADATNGEPYKDIKVLLYEPLGFVANPTGAQPVGEATVDSCGRFRAENIQRQSSGYIAVAIDDASGGSDLYMLTGSATATAPGERITGFVAFATKRSTVQAWDTSAGRTGNDRFEVKGVYMPIFLDPNLTPQLEPFEGAPKAGVQITEGTTTVVPAKDFYFSDSQPNLRTTIDPAQNATGANGTGLMIDTGLMNHSGIGGEPDNCSWPVTLSASVTGVVFAQERLPSVETGECN